MLQHTIIKRGTSFNKIIPHARLIIVLTINYKWR